MSEDTVSSDALLGRQPIVDRSGSLVAYELLFRNSLVNRATVTDDGLATDQVILNTISEFGIETTLGGHRGFVNMGRTSLESDSIHLLAPGRFTLEILENVHWDAEVQAQCRRLRAAGFEIALDDVVSIQRIPPEVLAQIDVVKVDLRNVVGQELPHIIRAAHDAGCTVVAEKVESQEEFHRILALGADLFQGYFFARPEILRQGAISVSQAALLRLVSVLAGDPALSDMQEEVKRNPVLLAQLMKLVHSARVFGRKDLTVVEAIARVGTRQISRLAQLLLFADGRRHRLEDDPLVQMVSTRARFMELLARELHPDDDMLADSAFQTGIFSLMHVLTRQTSKQLLGQIAPGPRISSAILNCEGELGDFLLMACLMEGFDLPQTPTQVLLKRGLRADRLNQLFSQATNEVLSSV